MKKMDMDFIIIPLRKEEYEISEISDISDISYEEYCFACLQGSTSPERETILERGLFQRILRGEDPSPWDPLKRSY